MPAVVAQPVEHDGSTVEAAGSIPADRSVTSALAEYGYDGARLKALAEDALYRQVSALRLTPLSSADKALALSELLEIGLRAALSYDESRDRGTGTVPLEVRWRQYAMIRMRLGMIDWLRREKGYTRHGTNGRVVPVAEIADAEDPIDVEDEMVSRRRMRNYRLAAEKLDLDPEEFALLVLDDAARAVLDASRPVVLNGGSHVRS